MFLDQEVMVQHSVEIQLLLSAAIATMDTIFEESFLAEVNEKADLLKNCLEEQLLMNSKCKGN